MSTLNPNDYVYLWHPTQQFLDRNGKPLIGGYVMVNVAGTTDVQAQTYVDWNGTLNARKIMLDSLGRATCIVADNLLYDMYVYNKFNVLEYSALNVCGTSGDGAGNLHFTSSDGSITITRNQNNVDLVVHADERSFGKITGSGTNADDSIDFDTTQYGDINANDGTITLKVGQLYHITMALRIENSTPGDDIDYCNVLDNTSQHHYFSLDESQTVQFIDLSWDMPATSQYVKFLVDIPERYTIATASMYIHAVNSLTVGGGSVPQVQSDWDQTNTSAVDYIKNKPDLSVYAESSNLSSVAFSGDYDDLSNKPTIPAAQVNSDWNANSGVSEILNKPDLSVYALSSSLATVATSGSYNDLNNKPSIPAAQVNSDWNANSGVAQILNKPNLATVATSGSYNDLSNKPSIPAAQVNSDWNASSGVAQILNKPNLATVATTGSYNDLSNTPSIPDGVPTVTSTDDGKVLKATYSGGQGSYSWETESGGGGTVDQTYNASSTNAQSGTAVAGAIANVKQVPASTSSDADKVLTVDSTGNPVWDDVPTQPTELFEAVYGTTTYAEVASAVAAKKIVYCRISPNASRMAVLSYIGTSNFEFRYPVSINDKSYSSQVDKVAVYNLTADGWTNTPKNTGTRVVAGTNMSYSYSGETLTLNADAQLPASTSSDSGKVLTVNSSGTPEWQAGGGGTQVQSNWTESDTSAVSYIQNKPNLATVATSGSYNDLSNTPTIPDGVPTVTSSDDGKVLTADYTGGVGSYSWETAGSGSTELFQANYGTTTYAEITDAITAKKLVFCRIVTGNNYYRMAPLSYVNKGADEVEFHFYRSKASGGNDSFVVYKVDSTNTWTTTERNINSGLFEALYGTTTYADIAQAIADKKVVYCRISAYTAASRMAFLAYIGTSGNPRHIEFQYYRSNPSGDDSIFVYDVTSSNTWTTTERPAGIKTQVNADWNASSGAAEILNKPTIPTVDQTYSSSSANAQSGVAVASAISGKQDTMSAGNMISISSNTVGVSTTAGITDIQLVGTLPANPVATVLYLIPEP